MSTFEALKSLAGDDPMEMKAGASRWSDSMTTGLEELKGEIDAAETREERARLQADYDYMEVQKNMFSDFGEDEELSEDYEAIMKEQAEGFQKSTEQTLEKLGAENPELLKALKESDSD